MIGGLINHSNQLYEPTPWNRRQVELITNILILSTNLEWTERKTDYPAMSKNNIRICPIIADFGDLRPTTVLLRQISRIN